MINKKAIKAARTLLTIVSLLILSYVLIKHRNVFVIKDYKYIFISLLIPLVVNPIISNNRWKYFLSLNGINESFFVLAKINFISIFYGLSLPSSQGYDAIRIILIEQRNPEKRGIVGSSVILERLMGLLSLSILSIVSLIIAKPFSEQKSIRVLAASLSLLIITIIIVGFSDAVFKYVNNLLYCKDIKNRYVGRIVQYFGKVHKTLVKDISFKVFLRSFALILVFQIASIVNVYLVYHALGIDIPLLIHFFIMPVVYVISMVPITISGIGLREGAFAYMYGTIGINPEIAVLASLMNYLIMLIVPAFIGMILVTVSYIKRDNLLTLKREE